LKYPFVTHVPGVLRQTRNGMQPADGRHIGSYW